MSSETSIRQGVFITFIAKYSNIIIQLIINSILARLLLPNEFGIITVITVFITFFTILGDMGLGPAIIQNKDLNKDDISSIFIFSIFASIIAGVLFYLFSYIIAYFYSDEIYIRLGAMLTFAVIFSILNIVPNAILSKNKDFKAIGVINVSSNLISGIITIVLAIKGFSYYALVLNSIIRSLLLFTLSYIKCNIKIKKEFKFNSVMKIMNYSIYQFSFSVINYFTRNLDNILIGKFLGAGTLGYYDKAYKLMLYPIQNLTHVITPVLHPILSEYQNEKDVIYNQYIKVIKLLSNIGIFISVYCFFTSKEAIRIMYGNNWDFSIPLFRILSISIVIQMVLSTIGSIFQATGYVNKLFSTGVISAFFTITAITIGIYSKSLYILTIGIVISFVLNFIQSFYVLITKVFKKSFIDFLKIFKNTVIIGIIMIVGYILTRKLQIENVIISAIFKLTIGIVFYGIGLIITGEYKLILRNKYSIYKKKIS